MARFLRAPWLFAILLLRPWSAVAQSGPVEVVFLDVGQGDAVVVRAPEGQTALVDAGPGVDLSAALEQLGIDRLDLVVASHPHADHIGGMGHLLDAIPVRFYMDNGQPHTTITYLNVMRTLRGRPEITYLESVPRTLTLGSVRIRVLPLPERASSNLNDHSIGLVIEHGAFRAFLSGDSERPELTHFLQAGAVPDVTLLKAPHHGSDDAVSEAFLGAARPEVVVISVGYGNRYGHPGAGALSIYPRYASDLYRTDVHGPVTVLGFDDGSYRVRLGETDVAEGRERLGAPGVPGPGSQRVGEPVGPEPGTARVAEPAGPGPEASGPTPEPATGGTAIAIRVFADAPGNDHRNTNGEYVTLSNGSERVMDISGWRLCDAARHCFTFPSSASVPAGGTVVLYTGHGTRDGSSFFMRSGSAVWNNDGDTATLYDRGGRAVARHVY